MCKAITSIFMTKHKNVQYYLTPRKGQDGW